ncbi:Shedu anti-phage system protein SduA domain-containing protein [Maridesulfovibrio sp. FT414]|uniref:Shedu anti-phage system protein SduA domain-containing protein n=1 Tax=Maridesulfovibrio sp. FT414 TaxID=2979469 RepID=UPI003D8026D8
MNKVQTQLTNDFLAILDSPAPCGRQKEQCVQDYLEQNPRMIPTPSRLHHLLLFDVIISKFPLGSELVTDYIYLTKSSGELRVVLVELENPDKDIFNKKTATASPTAQFNAAIDQVRSWQMYIDENRSTIIKKLRPLIVGCNVEHLPVSFSYELIIGRSKNKNLTTGRMKYLCNLINETRINIYTYDRVLGLYENDVHCVANVLKISGCQFAFKYMHKHPRSIFSAIGPDSLVLSSEQKDQLKRGGYEVSQWEEGNLLLIEGKKARREDSILFSHISKRQPLWDD